MLPVFFFFSSRGRHTIWPRDWSSDVCSSDLPSCPRGKAYESSSRRYCSNPPAASRKAEGPALPAPRRFRESTASAQADPLLDDARGDEHEQLGLVVAARAAAKQHAEERNISEEGYF